MKNRKLPLFALALMLFIMPAAAQTLVADSEPYVNQYITNATEEYGPRWWDALASELVLGVARPVGEVEETALQNVIFFAEVHGKRLDLKSAVPYLLAIYRDDEREGTRIMALAALHAIGNRAAMKDLREGVALEASPRVKRLTVAALAEYFH